MLAVVAVVAVSTILKYLHEVDAGSEIAVAFVVMGRGCVPWVRLIVLEKLIELVWLTEILMKLGRLVANRLRVMSGDPHQLDSMECRGDWLLAHPRLNLFAKENTKK